jgi:hypothetical protein
MALQGVAQEAEATLEWVPAIDAPKELTHGGPVESTLGMTDVVDRHIQLRQDMSEADTAIVMVHELAHVMLHGADIWGAVALLLPEDVREVEAETVTQLVSERLGLPFADSQANRHCLRQLSSAYANATGNSWAAISTASLPASPLPCHPSG